MKISEEKLKAIIDSHGKWLRDEEGGERADLRGAYLKGADLREADLKGADLQGADLREADLKGADLRYADLRGADLRYADLRDAYLRDADLRGADLREADLRGAYLPEGFYQVSNIGSVGRSTTYDSVNDQVICGCWNDKNGNTLENFEKRVKNEYGKSVTNPTNPSERYYAEYMAAIKFFKTMKKER